MGFDAIILTTKALKHLTLYVSVCSRGCYSMVSCMHHSVAWSFKYEKTFLSVFRLAYMTFPLNLILSCGDRNYEMNEGDDGFEVMALSIFIHISVERSLAPFEHV